MVFKKGHPCYLTKKSIEKLRLKMKGNTNGFKKGHHNVSGMKGKHQSEEAKRKIGLASKGNKYALGLPSKKGMLGKHHTNEWKINQSKIMKEIANPEWVKKCLRRRDKSSLETKMEDILNKYNLPYKFVGNGGFFIGNKVPDFINEQNKTAIEVFYRKHKEMFRDGGLEQWKKEREELFFKEGWKTIFFDETQVNELNVKKTLGE